MADIIEAVQRARTLFNQGLISEAEFNKIASRYGGWGNMPSGAPMPINMYGAEYNIRHGTAAGPSDFATSSGQYTLDGNWKARLPGQGG